jgi:hypothetical protein
MNLEVLGHRLSARATSRRGTHLHRLQSKAHHPAPIVASANLPAKVRHFPPGGVFARANVDTIRERRRPCTTEG